MKLKAAPHYVLVKCSIAEQKKRQEKIGSVIVPPSETYMIYNMEWGEIISIGHKAHKNFPQMKVGHTIIMHHYVQGESKADSKINHLIHEDKKYRYYAITTQDLSSDSFSRRNETYGVWDGEKIIPHPNFVFLKYNDQEDKTYGFADKESGQKIKKSKGGLFVFTEWKESNEYLTEKMGNIKTQTLELSKTKRNQAQVFAEMQKREEEMERISMKINSKYCSLHIVEYAPSSLSEKLSSPCHKGSQIFIENTGSRTIIAFKDKKFRMGLTKYVTAIKK